MAKTQNTLTMPERTTFVLWLNNNEKSLKTLLIPELVKKAKEELGLTIGYHTMQRQRAAMGWEKLTGSKNQHIIKVHLDDFEQRLVKLEERLDSLEYAYLKQ
jgi:hypothetical protein